MFGIFLLLSLECALEFLLWFTVCAFSWFGKMFLNNNNFFLPFHLETHAKLESINSSFNSPGMKPYCMWSFKWQLVNSTLLWAKISKTKLRQALLWQYILYIMTLRSLVAHHLHNYMQWNLNFCFVSSEIKQYCFGFRSELHVFTQQWYYLSVLSVILSICLSCNCRKPRYDNSKNYLHWSSCCIFL